MSIKCKLDLIILTSMFHNFFFIFPISLSLGAAFWVSSSALSSSYMNPPFSYVSVLNPLSFHFSDNNFF